MSVLAKPAIGVLLGAAALLVALAAGGLALADHSNGSPPLHGTVEVTGHATVMATPDTLTVDFTVSVVKPSSAAALSKANTELQTLENVFRAGGIPAKDLSTSNLSVGQNTNSKGQPDGYSADEGLTVTITHLPAAGSLIAKAQAAVGNDLSINDTNYSLSDQSAPLDQARTQAMQNAKRSAAVLARAVGEQVGAVVKITDQSSTTPITFLPEAARASVANTNPVPLKPGQQPVTATVDVVFSVAG